MIHAQQNGRVGVVDERWRAAPLFGRERERAELARLIGDAHARLITLVGVGGVGKTRLAVQAKEETSAGFRQGGRMVALASVPDASQVAATVAREFDLGTADARPASQRLQEHLASSEMLLVLDNFEHVLDAADLIVDLLNVAPRLVIMVTSRAPLRLWGEQVVEIAPLSVDSLDPSGDLAAIRLNAAVQLFLDRARLAGASLTDADLPVIAEICRRLDGLPLAVELAAAQTRALPLDAFLAPLEQRLRLLEHGPRDVHPRMRTMEASIDWSYARLEPAQQRLLQRLAVFTGGFSIEMGEAMAHGRRAGDGYPWSGFYNTPNANELLWGVDPTVERLDGVDRSLDAALPLEAIDGDPTAGIRALVEQSLLQLAPGRDRSQRYQMLETIRAFGLERLAASGELEAARHAHAAIVCSFTDACQGGLWTRLLRFWENTRIDDELGNIRAALAWLMTKGAAGAELAMRIANEVGLYWQLRGLVSEGVDWLERALALGPGADWCRSETMISLASMYWLQGRDADADRLLTESFVIAERIGQVRSQAQCIFYRGLIAWRQGDYALMRERIDAAFALFGEWQDIIGIGVCHLTYGVLDRAAGHFEAAAKNFEDARVFHDLVSYEWGMATSRYYGGEVARDLGDAPVAAKLQREALEIYWAQGDYWGSGASTGGLAALCAKRGRNVTAAQLFGASEALCSRVGAVLPPTELRAYQRIADDVRAAIGAELYRLAWQDGRSASPEQCVAMAKAAAAGILGESIEEPWLSEANEAARARAALAGLTEKRREILKLIVEGREIKEVAHLLKRDYNTVDVQLKAIQRAFDVDSKTELIIRIYRTGLYEAI